MNQEIYRIAFDFLAPAVNLIFQIRTRQNDTRPRQQSLQYCKLLVAQCHLPPLGNNFYLIRCRIEG